MMSPYWNVMNDLSTSISSYLTVVEMLRSNADDPAVVRLACNLLEHYVNVQDKKFDAAWAEVVVGGESDDSDSLEELTREELNLEQSKEQIYKNYCAVIDEFNELNSKYQLLLDQHGQLQDLFYEVDYDFDELKLKYDLSQNNYRAVVAKLKEVTESQQEVDNLYE